MRNVRRVVAEGGVGEALASPDVAQNLAASGVEIKGGTPEDASAMLKKEVAMWGRVVKESGVQMK